MTKLVIPEGTKEILSEQYMSQEIEEVEIPNSVTRIGFGAFYGNQLTSVTIPNGVTKIGDGVFAKNQLTSVVIPSSVTSIGSGAFSDNQLMSVTIPNGVTKIGVGAFADNQLMSVTIPNSVTRIGNWAFANNKLTSVVIPSSVTFIGHSVFYRNPNLIVTCQKDSNAHKYCLDSGIKFNLIDEVSCDLSNSGFLYYLNGIFNDHNRSDGSTADYYKLPEGATELQHLISHKNMNGQIAEIFRTAYRYGTASHSNMLRDAKKIKFYIDAEIGRLEKYR